MSRNDEPRKVLKELYIGIAISVVFFMLIGAFVVRPYWIFAIAIVVGGLGACLQAYGIYDCLDRMLELPEKNAKGFATSRSMIRLTLCGVAMAIAVMIHWAAFVGVSVGLLSLKIGALLNPFIRKRLRKDEPSYVKPVTEEDMIEGVEVTLDIEQK